MSILETRNGGMGGMQFSQGHQREMPGHGEERSHSGALLQGQTMPLWMWLLPRFLRQVLHFES